MKINQDMLNNAVQGSNQVSTSSKIIMEDKSAKKVLFLGNSITLHEIKPEIGWHWNWGMAATSEENDYVHQVVKGLKKKWGKVNYCITNVGDWETGFWDDKVFEYERFVKAREFSADVVIVRLGENVSGEKIKEYDFKQRFSEFLDFFTKPDALLIVTDLFWQYEEIDKMVLEVGEKHGARLVYLNDLGYDDTNKALGVFEHYGVSLHPNDKGMKAIADRILEKID